MPGDLTCLVSVLSGPILGWRATRCGNGPSFVHRQRYRGIASPVFSFRPIFNHLCGSPKQKARFIVGTCHSSGYLYQGQYILGRGQSSQLHLHASTQSTLRPGSLRRGSRSVARNTGHLHRRAPGHGHPLTRVRRPNRCKPENCSKDRVPPSCLDNIANANANICHSQSRISAPKSDGQNARSAQGVIGAAVLSQVGCDRSWGCHMAIV